MTAYRTSEDMPPKVLAERTAAREAYKQLGGFIPGLLCSTAAECRAAKDCKGFRASGGKCK